MLLWPFNKYPGTDYETFNWEWILKTVKEWVATMQTFKNDITAEWLNYKTAMTTTWNNFRDWLTAEVNQMHEDFTNYVNVTEEALNSGAIADGAITKPKINSAFLPEIENGYVTPEMYGAAGDGITDDTSAINQAFNTGKIVWFGKKTYAVSGRMTGNPQKIYGNGATIKKIGYSDALFVLTDTSEVSNIAFNGNNIGGQSVLTIDSTDDIDIENIHIYDQNDTDGTYSTSYIYAHNGNNIKVRNVKCENCSKVGNGVVGDAGALKVVHIQNYESSAVVENIFASEIHSLDSNGNIVMEDCDIIFIANDNPDTCAIISDVKAYNYGKRIIKTQCPNPIISKVWGYNDKSDNLAAIGVQGYQYNGVETFTKAIISDCALYNYDTYRNRQQYLISVNADAQINNCILVSPSNWIFDAPKKCHIANTSMSGYGIYITGTEIVLENIKFEGAALLGETGYAANLENLIINDSILRFTEQGSMQYNFFDHKYGKLNMGNTIIYSGILEIHSTGKTRIHNCDFRECALGDHIWAYSGANVEVKNCSAKSAENTLVRMIKIEAGATGDIKDIEIDGFTYVAYVAGTLKIRDIIPTDIWTAATATLIAYPEFVDTLPTFTASRVPDGVKVILTTDGKMYSKSGSNWVAVN